jgi:hypothetical protein
VKNWTSRILTGACACGLTVASWGDDGATSFVKTDNEGRRWSSTRYVVDGPELNPDWFVRRRAVVYLVPQNGDVRAVRRAATAILRDRWTEGDWTMKHIFIGAGPAPRFLAGRRAALRDLALEVTRAADQPEDFADSNLDFVRDHALFIRDPEGVAWQELLGRPLDEHQPAMVLLLDYGGRVVATFTLESEGTEAETEERRLAELAEEVRRQLPNRPELGG